MDQTGKKGEIAQVEVQLYRRCGDSIDYCPADAIIPDNAASIDKNKCTGCGACVDD